MALRHHARRGCRRCVISFVKDTFFGGAEKRAGQQFERDTLKSSERIRDAGKKSDRQIGRATSNATARLRDTSLQAGDILSEAGAESGERVGRGGIGSALSIAGGARSAGETLDPFINQGPGSGLQLQQRLSGAAGSEAQSQAFSDFEESPGVAFLRDQGLRLSGSKAGTGTGGGERLRELTKFSQGLALQDLNNQFARAGEVAGREQDLAGLRQSAGRDKAGIQLRGGEGIGESILRGSEGQAKFGFEGERGRAGALTRGAETIADTKLRGAQARGGIRLASETEAGRLATDAALGRAEGTAASAAGFRGGFNQFVEEPADKAGNAVMDFFGGIVGGGA